MNICNFHSTFSKNVFFSFIIPKWIVTKKFKGDHAPEVNCTHSTDTVTVDLIHVCINLFFFSTQKLESFILAYLCNISNLELCLFGHIEPPIYNICIPCSDSSHWYWRWCITYFHRTAELLCTQCLREAGVEAERDSHFWKCIRHLQIKLYI